jgi:hypothetical protein
MDQDLNPSCRSINWGDPIEGHRSSQDRWSMGAVCRPSPDPPIQGGIEGFPVRSLVEQKNVAAPLVDQRHNPRVTRIIRKRLFELLWNISKLNVHGEDRCFWRRSLRRGLSVHGARVA